MPDRAGGTRGEATDWIRAAALCLDTTLRGREDWPGHYLQHPLVSGAGRLMKEQLDALTRGSGFSFGDPAADRAGVRFDCKGQRHMGNASILQGNHHAIQSFRSCLHGGSTKTET